MKKIIEAPFSILEKQFGKLPRWLQIIVYVVVLLYFLFLTVYTLQGHLLYKGIAKYSDSGISDDRFAVSAERVVLRPKDFDISIVTDNEGTINLPLNMWVYYVELRGPSLIEIDAQIKDTLISVCGQLRGIFNRKIEVILPSLNSVEENTGSSLNHTCDAVRKYNEKSDDLRTTNVLGDLKASSFAWIGEVLAQDVQPTERKMLYLKSIFIADDQVSADASPNFKELSITDEQGEPVIETISSEIINPRKIPVLVNKENNVSGKRYLRLPSTFRGATVSNVPPAKFIVKEEGADTELGEFSISSSDMAKVNFNKTLNSGGVKIEFVVRSPYEVIVFKKDDVLNNEEEIRSAMNDAQVWHEIVDSELPMSKATNAIFFGEEVPFPIAHKVLFHLTNNWPKIALRRIEYKTILRSGRQNTIQIGRSIRASICPLIKKDILDRLKNSESYTDWDLVLSELSSCNSNYSSVEQ